MRFRRCVTQDNSICVSMFGEELQATACRHFEVEVSSTTAIGPSSDSPWCSLVTLAHVPSRPPFAESKRRGIVGVPMRTKYAHYKQVKEGIPSNTWKKRARLLHVGGLATVPRSRESDIEWNKSNMLTKDRNALPVSYKEANLVPVPFPPSACSRSHRTCFLLPAFGTSLRSGEMASLPETAGEGKTLPDAWDFKGRPAVTSRTGGWSCAATILGVELCERLTTLGIAVNLVTYLTGTMHLGSAASANIVTNFMGTSFMLCLLGGFIADTYLGRYLTIAIFTAVQASGVAILTISTAAPGLRPPACDGSDSGGCVRASGLQLGVLYLGLYLTALGTGGLKSSVSGFGSDQFDETDGAEKKQMTKFFSWFFFFISLGSLMAVTVLVYIQDNLGRRWGYGICAVAIVFGLVVFLSRTRRYRFKRLVGSPLTQVAVVVASAWRKRRLALPADPSMLYDLDSNVGGAEDKKKKQKLLHSKQFR
ncbi:Nitrate transporter 1.1 [Musa troglodytarum]|nr:Nitrate transporter 1.1 [Musa troglodytarum]